MKFITLIKECKMKVYQENFRYANASEKELVNKAYAKVPEKKRGMFLRLIILQACKKIVDRK